jgi:hypothetical protein
MVLPSAELPIKYLVPSSAFNPFKTSSLAVESLPVGKQEKPGNRSTAGRLAAETLLHMSIRKPVARRQLPGSWDTASCNPAGICAAELQLRETSWNDGAGSLLGFNSTEAAGKRKLRVSRNAAED